MARLITTGNLALFEYPEGAAEPEFTLDKNGVLFIFGYSIPFAGKTISTASRFETGLNNYTAIGRYDYAKTVIEGDFETVIEKENVDKNNCLFMVKTSTIPPA